MAVCGYLKKKKSPETESSVYTKLDTSIYTSIRRYQNEILQMVQMCCSASFVVFWPEDQREGGPSRAHSTDMVIARK